LIRDNTDEKILASSY